MVCQMLDLDGHLVGSRHRMGRAERIQKGSFITQRVYGSSKMESDEKTE